MFLCDLETTCVPIDSLWQEFVLFRQHFSLMTERREKRNFLYFISYILEYISSSDLKLSDFGEGKVHCSYSRSRRLVYRCSLEGLYNGDWYLHEKFLEKKW